MKPDDPVQGAFDPARSLEELDALQEQILEARAARRRKEAEFDAFIEGFRGDPPRKEPAEPPPTTRALQRSGPEVGFSGPTLPPIDAPAETPDIPREANTRVTPPVPTRRRPMWPAAVIVAGFVLGAAVLAVRARRSTTPPPEAVQTTAAIPESHPARVTPPPPPPAAPVQTGVNVEVTTRRRVWVRVTIDGQRAFERELPADQRIPLHADRSIVIRAGDAGAVAVARAGQEAAPLGRDGAIATKEFTAATSAPPSR